MKALTALITALLIPLMILNLLGGLVSGMRVGGLGEWGAVGWGVLFFFVSTGLLGFVLAPSLLLAAPAIHNAEKGNAFAFFFFSALSNIYTFGVITVWCCGILFLFVKDATASSLVPRLIWSYGVATGPLAYMASRDPEGSASSVTTALAQLAYVAIIVLTLVSSPTLSDVAVVFGVFMAVGLFIKLALVVQTAKEEGLIESVPDKLPQKRLFTVDFKNRGTSGWVDENQVLQWFGNGTIDASTWVYPSDDREWLRLETQFDLSPFRWSELASPATGDSRLEADHDKSGDMTPSGGSAGTHTDPGKPAFGVSNELQSIDLYELWAELNSGKLGPQARQEVISEINRRNEMQKSKD